MSLIKFAIIGGGWRAEFFLKIAQQLPERFQVTGMVVRNEEKGREIEQKWGVKTYRTLNELMEKSDFSFVIVSVPRDVAPSYMIQLAGEGVPVLCETPPAINLEELLSLHRSIDQRAKIQVAEQYAFQPYHAARLQIAKSGKLGDISQAQISVSHDYHGISLIRHFLGVTFEDATIQAFSFESTIAESPDRYGQLQPHKIVPSKQTIAYIRFGDKLGVYDFTYDQYFSWIRSSRVLVRGVNGEVNNFRVKYLKDYKDPVDLELTRVSAGIDGNLEGHYLKGIYLGEESVYKNPFIPGRLTDDEIAIATTLSKMDDYAKGGPSFYSLAEASQDHYLSLMIQKAVLSKETITTTKQPWI
ncbi:Gfo/Idh/MocA family oxidoreductase [Paenibacillus filicis]|uniref:Gfo/Idh/MocA family oxidoreductase n=1 Tax=Paenibacillus gyeongsangnamensis TaxID=3388067 RepID=A0ABT4QGU8_9BACL|nr:Gfo/Idh/MocA family oxidoreductase [Paenibacillus filicis]MCZ8516028.1 Gfo/Idh/MocA family oxidoreductase [Paenibacillus filicis]